MAVKLAVDIDTRYTKHWP